MHSDLLGLPLDDDKLVRHLRASLPGLSRDELLGRFREADSRAAFARAGFEGTIARFARQAQETAHTLIDFAAQCRLLDLEHHYRTGKPLFPLDDD